MYTHQTGCPNAPSRRYPGMGLPDAVPGVDVPGVPGMILNNKNYAENIQEFQKDPDHYNGIVRIFPKKLEFFTRENKPIAAINAYGVILSFSICGGKKHYGMAWNKGPEIEYFGINGDLDLLDDLRKYRVSERYIDTRKDGGIFSAFPDHEYRYYRGILNKINPEKWDGDLA